MRLIGKSSVIKDGVKKSTLYVASDFEPYQNDSKAGRTAEGEAVDVIYVADIDISNLEIGDTIEVIYGKAIRLASGSIYQPIKRIDTLMR